MLTFGYWQAGNSGWNNTDDENSLSAMHAAFEAGINFFVTPEGYGEGYGEGHSEELVSQFLREIGDSALLVTREVGVRRSCKASLQRLGRDKIDLYQIYWPAATWGGAIVPLEKTMGALLELRSEGKIGAIGVSNFNGAQIEEALQSGPIASLQPPYSLFSSPTRSFFSPTRAMAPLRFTAAPTSASFPTRRLPRVW